MKTALQTLFVILNLISCNNKAQEKSIPMEIKIENANPNAKKIMTNEFYYDIINEFAPFGNDVGNDTFYLYADWKKKNANESAEKFLKQELRELGQQNFDLKLNSKNSKELVLAVDKMPNQYVDINWIDNIIISLAFSQLFQEGKIEEEIKKLAKIAIDREIFFADFWGENAKDRTKYLNEMLIDLNKTP